MRLSLNFIFWLITFLFAGTSFFYTYNVISFKNRQGGKSGPVNFNSGQKVIVAGIIDGDEITVKMGEARFIVRILGIWSFDATANDTLTQGQGRAAVNYLQANVLNAEVILEFDKFTIDRNNRLLACVRKNGRDVGLDMVASGTCLVYTKYPFPRMAEYLSAEREAGKKKLGLWGDPNVRSRSLELKKLWERESQGKEGG